MFEIGEIFIFDCSMYVREGEMYRENTLKPLSREERGARKILLPTPFRPLENIGKTSAYSPFLEKDFVVFLKTTTVLRQSALGLTTRMAQLT